LAETRPDLVLGFISPVLHHLQEDFNVGSIEMLF
jgi:hypothetical protein